MAYGIMRVSDPAGVPSTDVVPPSARSAPNRRRNNSVRPAPISPKEPEDLALSHAERDRFSQSVPEQVFDLEHCLPGGTRGIVKDVGNRPAHHAFDKKIVIDALERVSRGDQLSVPENGGGVTELEDFGQTMRHVDNGSPVLPKATNGAEQELDFLVREAARRLVERDDLGISHERLGDFHHLLLPDGQAPHFRSRIDRFSESLQRLRCPCSHVPPVNDPEAGRHVAEKQILLDAHLGDEVELLVDNDYPGFERLTSVGEGVLDTSERERAAVRLVSPAENLQQGRLARPVLSDEGVDTPSATPKVTSSSACTPGKVLLTE